MTGTAEPIDPIEPGLAQLIIRAIEGRLYDLHTGLPAKVVSFNPTKQSAVVQPLLVRVFVDENEQLQQIEMPQLKNVPVVFPAGGGWSITWPLAPGNIVHLTFAERSIDHWLEAPVGTAVDPVHERKHDLSDAIAVPGLRPFTSPIPNISGENLRIARDDGSVLIELSANTARIKGPNIVLDLGGASDQSMVKGDALLTWLNTHTHPVPAAPGTSSPPTVPADASLLSPNAKLRG